jgi:glycosyltransferase involved in cell wall biosynthesis
MSAPARTRPIRVLHLRDTAKICGPAKTILETLRLNRDADIEYAVGSFGTAASNPFLEQAAGLAPVWAFPVGRGSLPSTILALARRLRAEEVDLVHAHDFKTDALGLAAGRLAGKPVVTTLHGYIAVSGKSRLYRALDHWLLARMKRVIAVSEAMASDLRARGVPSERLRVIRNGIRADRYPYGSRSGALDALMPVAPGRRIIGHVGRLSPEKGQALAIRALPAILSRVPGAFLVLAGAGPDEERLRRLVTELSLEGRVHFLGHRDDVTQVFAALDLLVLSSDTEGLPNVVLEAMALGVPVVATAVGGTPELVTDGLTGRLVPKGDEAALASAVVEALLAPDRSRAMALEARRLVEDRFVMEALVRETHRLYREILGVAA